MFLNSEAHLGLLSEMKAHALDMYEAIQCGDFVTYGKLVGKTWEQNKALDSSNESGGGGSYYLQDTGLCLGI